MKNPELYIIVALGFSVSLSWITSRFSDLSIGLFNTAVGLLFGATANLALMSKFGQIDAASATKIALTDYAIFLSFLQFMFGILVISSHFASKKLRKETYLFFKNKIKESLFYALSVIFSLKKGSSLRLTLASYFASMNICPDH